MSTYVQLELPLGLTSSRRTGAPALPKLLESEALLAARGFLGSLTDPRRTPRVPRAVRAEARALLARYPSREALLKRAD